MSILRFVRPSVIVLCIAALLLSACKEPVLEPNEVLRRSFFASHSIENYAFSMQGTVVLRGPSVLSGTVVADGVVQRGGAWSANVAVQSERIQGPRSDRIDGIAHVRVPGNGTLYIKTTGIAGEMGTRVSAALTDVTTQGWTRIVYPHRSIPSNGTPTQERIDAQVASLVVVADKTDPDSILYEYDVVLAPEVMQGLFQVTEPAPSLTGTLFIDRRSFALQRATWQASMLRTPVGNLSATVDVSFGGLNQSTLPTMPLFTGATIPLKTFFDIISSDLPLSRT